MEANLALELVEVGADGVRAVSEDAAPARTRPTGCAAGPREGGVRFGMRLPQPSLG
jgi:hypothetical protein